MSLIWKDPPGTLRNAQINMKDVLRELQANPGQWALIHESAKSSATGTYLRRSGVETVSRSQPDGTFHVYGRWPA